MNAVRIRDMEPDRGVLAVDLRHVLAALDPRARESTWRVRDVWAHGASWDGLEELVEHEPISGARLRGLADAAHQVIDGVFNGFDRGAEEPWVVIEAIDSAFYVVRSPEDEVLETIRAAFRDVSPHHDPQ